MVTIRQAEMDISSSEENRLTRAMVLDYITDKKVLLPIAQEYGWNVPYREMLQGIDVKERLSAQNSYIIIANTRNMERSTRIARALTLSFLEDYRKKWTIQSKKILEDTTGKSKRMKRNSSVSRP